jgi:phosphatidylglycerol:prolipoprotein diacylglycerol transferase
MRPILIEFELFDRYIVVESYMVFNLIINPLVFIILGAIFLSKITGNKIRSIVSSIFITCVVLIGARLFWYVGVAAQGGWNSVNPFRLHAGGFTMVGGFVFAAIFFPLLARFNRISTWQFLDALTPGWALGIGFNKIGCFLNGCCIGIETDSAFGMLFPRIEYPKPVFPTQLYESVSGFIGFLLVLIILHRQKAYGLSFSFFAFYFSIVRFLLDFVKEVPPRMTLPSVVLPISYALLVLLTGYLFITRLAAHKRSIMIEKDESGSG